METRQRLFAPLCTFWSFSCLCCCQDAGEEKRISEAIGNKKRTVNGFVRHAACKDTARTGHILVGSRGCEESG